MFKNPILRVFNKMVGFLSIYALGEQISVKAFDRSQMNTKKFLNNTAAISVQLPYIAGHSL